MIRSLEGKGEGELGLRDAEIASLLMQKYSLLREESLLHLENTKSHVQQLQVFVGVVIAVTTLASTFLSQTSVQAPTGSSPILSFMPIEWGVWVIALIFVTTVANYLWLDVFESYLAMHAVGARMRLIESEINSMAHKRLLLWETSGAFNTLNNPIFRMPNPGHVKGTFAVVLMILGAILIPCYFYFQLLETPPDTGCTFYAIVYAAVSYTIILTPVSLGVGFKHLISSRDRTYAILENLSKKSWSDSSKQSQNENNS